MQAEDAVRVLQREAGIAFGVRMFLRASAAMQVGLRFVEGLWTLGGTSCSDYRRLFKPWILRPAPVAFRCIHTGFPGIPHDLGIVFQLKCSLRQLQRWGQNSHKFQKGTGKDPCRASKRRSKPAVPSIE